MTIDSIQVVMFQSYFEYYLENFHILSFWVDYTWKLDLAMSLKLSISFRNEHMEKMERFREQLINMSRNS